jgi:dihydrofolate synthase/folylpolyglutamate synthase
VFAEVVITQANTSTRHGASTTWRPRVDVFGEDRVEVSPRLDNALDAAVASAEEDSDHLGGSGVLVTGSIYTVAEARTLLGGGAV